jgi:hypothetical protein
VQSETEDAAQSAADVGDKGFGHHAPAGSRLDLVVRHRFLDPVASSRRPATAERSRWEGGNPHEGCAALVLDGYHQRRARATRRQAGVSAATASLGPESVRCQVSSRRAPCRRPAGGTIPPCLRSRDQTATEPAVRCCHQCSPAAETEPIIGRDLSLRYDSGTGRDGDIGSPRRGSRHAGQPGLMQGGRG